MSRFFSLLVLLAAPALARADLQVAATTPALAALAREVGGSQVSVTALSSSRQDPHYVDARPSLVINLNRADLLVVNGLELEVGWLPPLLTAARNSKIQVGGPGYFDSSQFVHRLQVPAAKIDRSMGDIHPGGNPHFTYDPRAGAAIARALGDRLAQLDPDNAAGYHSRAQALGQSLDAFAAAEKARFAAIPETKRKLVAYHESLTYLFDWLGLSEAATLEPRPGIPPDPAHVADVLRTMRATGANVITEEEFYPGRTAQTLAKLAGAKVVTIQGGPRFDEGQTYLDWVKGIAEEIHGVL